MPATVNTPISGTDGRVIVGGTTVGLLFNWTLVGTTGIIKIPHFEGPVDTQSRTWTNKLFGLSDGNGTLEGFFNVNAANPSDSILTNGVRVLLALILIQSTNFGFGVVAALGEVRTQNAVENQAAKFSANFEIDGVIPLSAIVV